MKKRSLYIILLLFILSIIVFRGILVDEVDFVDDDDTVNHIDDIIDDKDLEENIEEIEEILEPINIDILAVGDIMFHMPQINSGQIAIGQYDFKPIFRHVKEYIQDADLALANYETVTLSSRPYSGFPRFNSPHETIESLEYAGFDVLSTANNHSLDQGKEGIISTIEAIKANGMNYAGTNLDKGMEPLVMDVEGIRIGILSYTYGLNGLDSLLNAEELSYMVNLIDEEKIKEDIEELKNNDVDLILSYIHWGHEYHHQPSDYQLKLGRDMVHWGINIVFGSHPHVVQKSEIIEIDGRDNFIIYSMGNFLSNQREVTMGNPYTEDGVMVKLAIEKDLEENETIIKDVEYIPTWVYRYSEDGRYLYEILPVEDVIDGIIGLDINGAIKSRIEKSFNDTKSVYGY